MILTPKYFSVMEDKTCKDVLCIGMDSFNPPPVVKPLAHYMIVILS